MTDEKLHLVYATDKNYLKPAAVAIGSAYLWASDSDRLVVHLLACNIDDEDWDAWLRCVKSGLPNNANIVRHVIDMREFDSFGSWHASKATYARLRIEDLIPDAKWCVYCDCDTLFTDDPLKLCKLFDPQMAMIGHQDRLEADQAHMTWLKEKGIWQNDGQYVCAGFLLMNLEIFRKEQIGRKCIKFIAENPDVKYPDQDALNMLCKGRVGYTPHEWGLFSWEAFGKGRPSLIHYVADLPWKVMRSAYPDFNDPQRLWFRYAKKLYGWTKRDVATEYSIWRFLRRALIGGGCRVARRVSQCRYLRNHYASAEVWSELAKRNFGG